MSSCVRVLNITHVLPDQNRAAAYSPSPQPLLDPDDGIMKLTFMDSLFVDRVMPMRRLFFYEGPNVPPFPDLVGSLRSSLATALAIFTPLAGKLTYRRPSPSSACHVVVDCSPAAVSLGVRFVEAEYAGSIDDMRRVASGAASDAQALVLLLGAEDGGVQVTVTLHPEHMEGFASNLLRVARPGGRGIVAGVLPAEC